MRRHYLRVTTTRLVWPGWSWSKAHQVDAGGECTTVGTVSLGASFGGTRAEDVKLDPDDGSSIVMFNSMSSSASTSR